MYNEQSDYLDEVTGQSILHQQLNDMALYGATPNKGETDHRFLPDLEMIRGVVEEMFANLAFVFENTRLEAECDDLHWNIVNVFHHKITRLERAFDQMNFDIRALIRAQDGSEIKANELEQTTDDSQKLSETIEFFTAIREYAAELYTSHTGQCWMPAQGSRTTTSVMNGAVLDAKQHLKAKAQQEQQKLNPDGDKILIAGGQDYTDHNKVFQVLDKTLAKHPDMVLIHGGSPKGVDHIAAKWATGKNITQIICKPDWTQGKRAGFLRNDQMICLQPIGAIIFTGSGITENLADKAKANNIPVKRCD